MLEIAKKPLTIIIALMAATLFMLTPAIAGAQSPSIEDGLDRGSCLGVGADATDDCPTGDEAEQGVDDIIATVINILSIVVGVVSVIMIIIGGFRYVLSGGESGNVTSAKNTILFAIVGLVIVAFAQIIVRFVLDTTTGE